MRGSSKKGMQLFNQQVVSLLDESKAFTNNIYFPPELFTELQGPPPIPKEGETEGAPIPPVYFLVKGSVFKVDAMRGIKKDEIGLNNLHRQFLKISKVDTLNVENVSALDRVDIEIDCWRKSKDVLGVHTIKDTDIENQIKLLFKDSFINEGHMFVLKCEESVFIMKVKSFIFVEDSFQIGNRVSQVKNRNYGRVDSETNFEFTLTQKSVSQIKIKSTKMKEAIIFKTEFNFEKLGIGGLDIEFGEIFRRAFNLRRFPPAILEQYGIKHVKGMLLFGPPGTGKTLIARQIATSLEAHEPKIVNGPEVFSKFVGQTEENIRKLFEDAEKEEKEMGENSKLHIIIFDEIDAICKPRGTVSSGTGVHDTAVNQILSKIDGVNCLNNILVIGMTNRKDLIDEAVLRPGRLEVHVEIGLPDEPGREQIYRIHTKTMREHDLIGSDVDLGELASLSKNFSGAEIEGIVKSATSFALFEGTDVNNIVPLMDFKQKKKVVMKHFHHALKEIKPMFGIDTSDFDNLMKGGIISYGKDFGDMLDTVQTMIKQVENSPNTPLLSLLLEGPRGCGKTAFAAKMALDSQFPFVKLITAEMFIGYTENGKVNEINRIFNDSYKSPLSIIVLDDIERIIEYISIGPRFSNPILQSLLVLATRAPPYENRRLMIIGTTSMAEVLTEFEIIEAFNVVHRMPVLNTAEEISKVLVEYKGLPQHKEFISKSITDVPIKSLLLTCEMSIAKGSGELTQDGFMACFKEVMKSSTNHFARHHIKSDE